MLKVGDVAPSFVGTDHLGGQFALADALAIGPTFVLFMPFASSPVCTGELAAFSAAEELGPRVVVTCDPTFALQAWAGDAQIPLVSDFWPHGDITRQFGVFMDDVGAPQRASFLIAADGTVAWTHVSELGQARSVDEHIAARRSLSA